MNTLHPSFPIGAGLVVASLLIAVSNWFGPATFNPDVLLATIIGAAAALGYGLLRRI